MLQLLNSFLLGNKPPEPPPRHSRAPAWLTQSPPGLEDSEKGLEIGGEGLCQLDPLNTPDICSFQHPHLQFFPSPYWLLIFPIVLPYWFQDCSLWDLGAQGRGPYRREQERIR